MNRIRYDLRLIKYMSLFETFTGIKAKDCINTNPIIFIVDENNIAKAIGKQGANVKRLERVFNRKIKIVEFNPDVLEFTKNLIYPLKVDKVYNQENTVIIDEKNSETKAKLIGRDKENLKNLTDIVKRHFDIDSIKVA